jgi:FkbM family methyltransferase
MVKLVHKFDNGIKVFENQLMDIQKKRYRIHNIHEAEEEPIFLDASSTLIEGGVFVNIGAAIGYYPMLAATVRNDLKLISYEPLKKHRKYFNDNIKLNRLAKSRFKIYKEGVFKRSGSVNFKVDDYGSMIVEDMSVRPIMQQVKDWLTNSSIQCITLNELIEREGGDVDLVQMDIQGLEASMFESAEKYLPEHNIKKFLIGTHSLDIHHRCIDVLKKCGYQIFIDKFETSLQPDGILLAGCELR